ncbi:hypothetical protein KW846_03460 [Pseudomonas sp. PDM32]|uniref:hypothetical protein n=1 Tax=Pseudomonas sp. PDM32 TaxID=2854768 RepID=UPI001C47DA9D|nr:hypothetical protein [Pseudomonas sp. PDM32]MBV7571750.1 hypothetical protein [Pseudomonas sp. PDM32]
MSSKFRQSLMRLDGYQEIDQKSSKEKDEVIRSSGAGVEEIDFKLGSAVYHSLQISTDTLTISIINVSFRFPTEKKSERSKLYSMINAYNKSRIALKAVLGDVQKEYFEVKFSVEFICPDVLLNDEIIHPAVKVLSTSGRLLLGSLGGHGITIKDVKQND